MNSVLPCNHQILKIRIAIIRIEKYESQIPFISPRDPITNPETWQNLNITPPQPIHATALFCSMVLYPKSSSIDRRTSELKNNKGNWYKTFWQLTLVFLAVSDKKLKISSNSEDLEMANSDPMHCPPLTVVMILSCSRTPNWIIRRNEWNLGFVYCWFNLTLRVY